VVEKAVEYGKEGILNGFDFWGLGNIAQGSKVLGSISSTQKKKKLVTEKSWQVTDALFFLVVLGFELRAYTLSHTTSSFLCWGFTW
jgi:hypothetical protein